MPPSSSSAAQSSTEKTPLVAEIRSAFNNNNADASRRMHDARDNSGNGEELASASENGHQSSGGLLKPVIFGGLDGILTSFAIVAGAAGGKLNPQVVLILGFSNIFADALSMGVGEFLSSKADSEWILSERRREEWELENYPEGEIKEMVELYKAKGVSHEDAVQVITTMVKYKDFYVDMMVQQELGLQVPEKNYISESCREGCVMFCSFAFFGALPLLGYVIIPILFPDLPRSYLFVAACVITALVLFFMGSIKSLFSASHWFRSGSETLLLGGACATVAYGIGQFVQGLGGGDIDV